jgi:hypothetical protein
MWSSTKFRERSSSVSPSKEHQQKVTAFGKLGPTVLRPYGIIAQRLTAAIAA